MQDSTYTNTAYPSHDVRLSESDSGNWDKSNADERRQLISTIAEASIRVEDDLDGCTVRVFHASGRLLAKTVLHAPLFNGA